MLKKYAIATVVMASLSLPALASGLVVTDEIAGKIRETLTAQGYSVGKIKIEDGLFEAYAKKDGKKYEVFLNDKMEVVRTKED